MKYMYELEFDVRDYECDLQGIVNNANYQHYYEHTRHYFLNQNGINFAEMHENNIDFVVARIEIGFKTPLKANDRFKSVMNIRKEGIKYIFDQKIIRLDDNKVCNTAKVTTVVVDNGKLSTNGMFDEFIAKLEAEKTSK